MRVIVLILATLLAAAFSVSFDRIAVADPLPAVDPNGPKLSSGAPAPEGADKDPRIPIIVKPFTLVLTVKGHEIIPPNYECGVAIESALRQQPVTVTDPKCQAVLNEALRFQREEPDVVDAIKAEDRSARSPQPSTDPTGDTPSDR